MSNILVVFPKLEDAKGIKSLLSRQGYTNITVYATGAQVLAQIHDLNDGIVICGYKLRDMIYSELQQNLPETFDMLLMASRQYIEEVYGTGIVTLAMPLKVHELYETVDMMTRNLQRRRRKRREQPRVRDMEEVELIREAKELLMSRNNMTEEEAHRYIQKCSMDSSTNMVETAQMVLSLVH